MKYTKLYSRDPLFLSKYILLILKMLLNYNLYRNYPLYPVLVFFRMRYGRKAGPQEVFTLERRAILLLEAL